MAEELSMNEHDNIEEFVIQIGARTGDYYPVTVLRSPVGTGGNGRFPVRDFLSQPATPTGSAPASAEATRQVVDDGEPVPRLSEDVGRDLFEALFTGEIGSLFQRSLGRTSAEDRRLRVRLHLNVGNESIAPLATLPWELMFRQDRRAFLTLSPDTTFVRSLDVPIDFYDLRDVEGSVRVLFVMSNPKGDLNLGAERAAIEQELAEEMASANPPMLVTEFLENATFAVLEERLHRSNYHVIHFMGHGDLSATGEGMLLFHDGLRSGRDFGELMKSEPMTRLVTLNACNTGTASKTTGSDPFAGVAAALVMAGVPAVIAMQFPVSDKAAIAFSARLYSEIGLGRSIEASVDSGRRKIKALRPNQTEWATPVLFLRDPALSAFNTSRRSKGSAELAGPTGDMIVPRSLMTPMSTPAVSRVVVPAPVSAPAFAALPAPAATESAPWFQGTIAKVGGGALAMLFLIVWLALRGPDDGVASDSTALAQQVAAESTTAAAANRAAPGSMSVADTVPLEPEDEGHAMPIEEVVPVYPKALQDSGVEGEARVSFIVDTTGEVESESVRVLSASNRLFGQAARKAVLSASFHPGTRRGMPVRSRLELPFVFSLTRAPS